jgi:hypothetical protein
VINRLNAWARSPLGRALAILTGVGCVALLIYKAGPTDVWNGITRAPGLFVLIFGIELFLAVIESWASIALYGPEKNKIPVREMFRISLFVFALIGVLPFGRAAGEAARAAMMSRYVGMPLATASAARMQSITLLGNAFISIPCGIGSWLLTGPSWVTLGIAIHFVVTGGIGAGLLLAGRHSGLGQRLKKYFRSGDEWGAALDAELQSYDRLWGPTAWTFLSRAIRLFQRAALLAAVGVSFGPLFTLTGESINLVAGMVGDIIPMRIGVNEAIYAVGAKAMSMSMSDAIAMALLAHVAQLFCVGIGFFSPLLGVPEAERAPAP